MDGIQKELEAGEEFEAWEEKRDETRVIRRGHF